MERNLNNPSTSQTGVRCETINHFFFDNGFKVIYAVDNSYPLVSLQLFIKIGAAFESDNEAGFSHLMEHLVFKSTRKFPKNGMMDYIAMFGGSINAYTDHESTCFYINIPSKYVSEGLDTLFELFAQADFTDADFILEKNVVLEELKQYQNDPEESFVENIPSMVLSENPYARLIIGNKESLKKATADELRTFYRKYYCVENAFLVLAGDLNKSQLEDSEFGKWESVSNTGLLRTSQGQVGLLCTSQRQEVGLLRTSQGQIGRNFSIKHVKKAIKNDILAFVLPEVSDNHRLCHASELIGKVFAIGNNSRLYQRLCVVEKLVDCIRFNSISGLYDGMMIIVMLVRKNARVEEIVDIFFEEYEKISKFGITSDEIKKAKRELIKSAGYIYELMEGLAQAIAYDEILGDYRTFFEYENDLFKVSDEEIKQYLNEYYNYQWLHVFKAGKKGFEKDYEI